MPDLANALGTDRVLLMDGAMATELQRAGLGQDECAEYWCLAHPERVLAVHRAYVAAGAECLVTNTFQANPLALARRGLASQLDGILSAAVELARDAGAKLVLGSIGPSEDSSSLGRIASRFSGVDGVLLETWSTRDAVAAAQRLRDKLSEIPVFLSFAFIGFPNTDREPFLQDGTSPREVAALAQRSGISGLGLNCGREIGVQQARQIVRAYRQATDLPLLMRLNAGTPEKIDWGWLYPGQPADMAVGVAGLVREGVAMVGGCCGMTPAHIGALAPFVKEWNRCSRPG